MEPSAAAIEDVCRRVRTGAPEAESEWRETLLNAQAHALHTLEEQAERQRCAIEDFATTFLVAIASPEKTAALQIGDGSIVWFQEGNDLRVLTVPDNGEYSNETQFLTCSNSSPQIVLTDWCDGLVMFTDGLQRLVLDVAKTPHAHDPFFLPLLEFLDGPEYDFETHSRALAEYLSGPAVSARTDDDLTLVVAKRSTEVA